ncbi:HNH endonuclease signature motif containing protein [Streptomyces sp. FXJ1.172]|uniref:HNH endonuclease n=1 Tax=Streptomyces sp. FXJ1.172 TaxID=710705 RepID=UPI0007CF42D1|nr:HNH endonuclease signature motif containing protein [Streptomyces sp. FXJ1.172]WEO97187.1 HNH endonuclease signature motif containing protein [Streptomyces sp. FXJ1.172]
MSEENPQESSSEFPPAPDSIEVAELGLSAVHLRLYEFLYNLRHDPPTMLQIRAEVADENGSSPAQTDRRVRDLRDYFSIDTVRDGRNHRYRLRGWNHDRSNGLRRALSRRLRAQVLAPQRCAQCGRTPTEHHVILVVDHKVPRHWGGNDDIENLQPLCEDCNSGKKAFYSTYDEYAEEIKAAADHDEPHGRIGELLKAFRGDWVPSELISVVASMRQYQDDWQKRLRELRTLGWKIDSKKKKDPESGRFRSFYCVKHWEPWPEGSIRAEISRLEREGKQ